MATAGNSGATLGITADATGRRDVCCTGIQLQTAFNVSAVAVGSGHKQCAGVNGRIAFDPKSHVCTGNCQHTVVDIQSANVHGIAATDTSHSTFIQFQLSGDFHQMAAAGERKASACAVIFLNDHLAVHIDCKHAAR